MRRLVVGESVRIRSRVKGWGVLPRFTPVARVARVARVTRAEERTNRLGPAGRAAALRAPAEGRPEDGPERAARTYPKARRTEKTATQAPNAGRGGVRAT